MNFFFFVFVPYGVELQGYNSDIEDAVCLNTENKCLLTVKHEGSELCFDKAPYCKKRARVSSVQPIIVKTFSCCPVVEAVWRKAQKPVCKALTVFFIILTKIQPE
jgi:hypothetical protein